MVLPQLFQLRLSMIQEIIDLSHQKVSKLYYQLEFAGLGGEKKWIRNTVEGSWFKRVYGDLVFRSHLKTSKLTKIGGQRIPNGEQYSLGGSRNLRGWESSEAIGPMQSIKTTGVNADGSTFTYYKDYNIRGLHSIFTQIELEHPLVREAGLKWVIFADAGNVYSEYMGEDGDYSLHVDYGFGFRWFSPIGVLRFEFGFPLGPRSNGNSFNFDIGQIF